MVSIYLFFYYKYGNTRCSTCACVCLCCMNTVTRYSFWLVGIIIPTLLKCDNISDNLCVFFWDGTENKTNKRHGIVSVDDFVRIGQVEWKLLCVRVCVWCGCTCVTQNDFFAVKKRL